MPLLGRRRRQTFWRKIVLWIFSVPPRKLPSMPRSIRTAIDDFASADVHHHDRFRCALKMRFPRTPAGDAASSGITGRQAIVFQRCEIGLHDGNKPADARPRFMKPVTRFSPFALAGISERCESTIKATAGCIVNTQRGMPFLVPLGRGVVRNKL